MAPVTIIKLYTNDEIEVDESKVVENKEDNIEDKKEEKNDESKVDDNKDESKVDVVDTELDVVEKNQKSEVAVVDILNKIWLKLNEMDVKLNKLLSSSIENQFLFLLRNFLLENMPVKQKRKKKKNPVKAEIDIYSGQSLNFNEDIKVSKDIKVKEEVNNSGIIEIKKPHMLENFFFGK